MSNPGPANSTWNGLVKERPGGWVAGDGYAVGDDPLREKVKAQSKPRESSDTDSFYSSRSDSRASSSSRAYGNMSRDRYEPAQYSERGYAANDGYARDSNSDYYEQSRYGGTGGRASAREPAYVSVAPYVAPRYTPQRRNSYDYEDADGYYERSKVVRYKRDVPVDRGLVPYADDRQRARSQDVYRREEKRSRSRSRKGSVGSSDGERESSNTPAKKWISTFVGAAIGGAAANQIQKGRREHEGPGWKSTAVGAVIGGVLARELEKVAFEHKDKKREREREREGR